jgi:cytochrome c oxidase assembly protein subunit 15
MTSSTDHTYGASSAAAGGRGADRAVGLWLLACAFMVLAMAVIGAITRLTESGLSIMEWAPLTGALPPFSEAEWQRLFDIYKQIPEYTEENAGMTLAEFRTIFWWEYIHRLWGRLIGVVFALPFLWFLVAGRIARRLAPHLIAIFVLGALQGGMGWYMVASGFADLTDVSQYRLVAHLVLAVAIYGYLLWVAFGRLAPDRPASTDRRTAALRRATAALVALVVIAVASGGFVAGTNAGFTYNTFPLMDGDLVPAGYGDLQPWLLNHFENLGAVQFNHRLLAAVALAAAAGLWLWSRRLALSARARQAMALVFAMALLQFALGVSALLLVVPVWLGALHQGGALVLLGLGLWACYQLRPPAPAAARP